MRPPSWPTWELFATNHVDRALYDRCELSLDALTETVFMAGMLGYDRYRKYDDDAYDAGRLARRMFDERSTNVSRIWEIVAANRRGWSSIGRVHTAWTKRYGSTMTWRQIYLYLQHLVKTKHLEARNTQAAFWLERYQYRRRLPKP